MPLTNDTFTLLMGEFEPFEAQPHLAVAVSGGSDSMALALLTHHWVSSKGGRVTALVIDHGLRPESRTEAQQVRQWLQPLGIETHILTWEGEKPNHRIQERARQARYALLEQWCQGNGVIHLLTAHQGDDQWETMMQRLSRKSGDRGLQGILPERRLPFGRLLRPLLVRRLTDLGIPKDDILMYLKTQEQAYINDPSNDNSKYERVRWRQERTKWEQKGFTRQKIADMMNKATVSFQERELAYRTWALSNIEISSLGYICINRTGWEACTPDLQDHILQHILSCFQDTPYPTPTPTLETIRTRLNRERTVGAAGCLFVKRGDEILITREVRGLPMINLCFSCEEVSETPIIWDRFQLTFLDDRYEGWRIEPLGPHRADTLKASGDWNEPSYVLASLPCFVSPRSTEIVIPFGRSVEEVQVHLRFPHPLVQR